MIETGPHYPTLTGAGAGRLLDRPWRIVIAGAGGWMGRASIEQLHGLLGDAFEERVVCFGSTARTLTLRGGLAVAQQPLREMANLPAAPSLVLYFAFLTQEKAGLMSHDAYVAANRAISDTVFDALGPIGAEGVFVASSGAVEMVGRQGADPNKALYGELKLQDERRFAEWAESRRRRTVTARIYGLSGPYINKIDSYALACFIVDVLSERPIAITANRPVYRSYVAIDELMSVAYGLMTDGARGVTRFDTGAERAFEMGEIAADVAVAMGHRLGITRPKITETEADYYAGDGADYDRLRRRLEVTPVDFRTQVCETGRYMAEAGLHMAAGIQR